MQHFVGTAHEHVIAEALMRAEDHQLSEDQAAAELKAGIARYWDEAQRSGRSVALDELPAVSAEEAERRRQLEMVRRGTAPAPHGEGS